MSIERIFVVVACAGALLVGGARAARAGDPSVSLSIDRIKTTREGTVVAGKVTVRGPESGGGASHSYRTTVVAEIKEGPGAVFPKLPEGLFIRAPKGAETAVTPGSGPRGTMTKLERHGRNIATVELGGAVGTGSHEFEGTIPAKHGGREMRIRAELNYQFNHVNAAWPAIRFFNDEGPSGTLSKLPGVPVAPGSTDDAAEEDDTSGEGDGEKDPAEKPGEPDKPEDPPYEVDDDLGVETPEGDNAGELGSAGKVQNGAPPEKLSDEEFIAGVLQDVQHQLQNNDRLSKEQRDELTQMYNEAVQALAEMEGTQIWLDYTSDTIYTGSDLVLSYSPGVGPVWTAGKVGVDLYKGKWASAAQNASTLLGNVKIPGKAYVITKAGQKIQLVTDYLKIAKAGVDHLPDRPDEPKTSAQPKHQGGIWNKWGTKGTPGTPEPVLWGVNR